MFIRVGDAVGKSNDLALPAVAPVRPTPVNITVSQLRNSPLKTARAWELKETAIALYHYVYERLARSTFPGGTIER